jgi:hypothetical protein
MVTKKYFFLYDLFINNNASEIGFGKINGWKYHSPRVLYNIVRHKRDTIAKVLKFSPPNVTLKRDLILHRLVSWNALLQCLALVELT